jgi:mRNA-degrading endonuclease RelE of RelBE toxin-antitoxin system
MARVQLTRQATRHFETLPARLQEPVLNTLTDMGIDPQAAGKPLLGRLKGLWSARVGSYRIIYSIEGSRRSPKVIVRAIKHRSSAYGQPQRRR